MTHTYQLTGMTCGNCEAKVKSSLLTLPGVITVTPSKDDKNVTIEMEHHIAIDKLQKALGGKDSRYQLAATQHNEISEQTKNWLQTYKPILLIFAYIVGITVLIEFASGEFSWMNWMYNFMGGFFLVFSFFKLLNLKGFAESYAMYDIVARRWNAWGFIYAFIELGLGIAFIMRFSPVIANAVAFVVMSISIIGVLQSVFNKRKIKCACLGDVFNLPMSTVTIIEDALMIAMSGMMLFQLL